jgi:hypothetical protein
MLTRIEYYSSLQRFQFNEVWTRRERKEERKKVRKKKRRKERKGVTRMLNYNTGQFIFFLRSTPQHLWAMTRLKYEIEADSLRLNLENKERER